MLDGYQAVNQRGKHQIILIYNQIGEIQPQSSQATYNNNNVAFFPKQVRVG